MLDQAKQEIAKLNCEMGVKKKTRYIPTKYLF